MAQKRFKELKFNDLTGRLNNIFKLLTEEFPNCIEIDLKKFIWYKLEKKVEILEEVRDSILECQVIPPEPQINFDVTGDWSLAFDVQLNDPFPITDESTFVAWLTNWGHTVNSISNFSLVDGRLSCFLDVDSASLLQLQFLEITEVNDLSPFVNITELILAGNLLTEIPLEIANLVNLEILHLSTNQITTIENLETLVNLEELYLIDNQITKIENLETLLNLTTLDISQNQISTIENLETLVNLENLALGDNQITKIENLENSVNMYVITLRGNQITTIENLNVFTNLFQLDLAENLIDTVTDIDDLVNLSVLALENNQITTSEFDKLNTWAVSNVNIGGGNSIFTANNIDNFNTSTAYTVLLGKGWTITT